MRRFHLLVSYPLAWSACVGGAALGQPLIGVVVVLALLTIWGTSQTNLGPFCLVLGAALGGWLLDTVLASLGVLVWQHESPLSPPWMASLWAAFAAFMAPLLAWLGQRPALAVIAGVIGGPMAYLGGVQVGALGVAVTMPVASLSIAVEWGVALPVLCWFTWRLEGAGTSIAQSARQAGLSRG